MEALSTWLVTSTVLGTLALASHTSPQGGERRLSLEAYRDHMAAGWIGQMAGVGQGAPTEFKYRGRILPAEAVPPWTPERVNQFEQDDLYVEMTFLRSLEQHGLEISPRQAGIDFASSGYAVWHGNRAGRQNLRAGIAPPDCGHPRFSRHADDIDYQIEADYSGLIAPGMPAATLQLGEIFGRMMGYGDGLYGGLFVGGMVAEAFFEEDPRRLVEAGLRCIPADSQYAACIRDVLAWHEEEPQDWQATWRRVESTWRLDPDHRRFSCTSDDFDIDAKLNGAYVVLGLLYGERDPARTIEIAMRCGQDSDCNPSSAAGVLFTSLGLRRIPSRYHSALDRGTRFDHTPYDFDRLLQVCEALARVVVERGGGRIEQDATGREFFVIPRIDPRPGPAERCWDPGPIAGTRFTAAEMESIPPLGGVDFSKVIDRFAPGWEVLHCGPYEKPGYYEELAGRKGVLVTHPFSDSIGCTLRRRVELPPGRASRLHLVVGHDPRGDWTLVVRADHEELRRVDVGPETSEQGWRVVDVDLGDFAGRSVLLELVNEASGWAWETGRWDEITLAEE